MRQWRSFSRRICKTESCKSHERDEKWKNILEKSVYKGIAIGPVHVLKKRDHLVKRIHVDHVEKELERLEKAKEQAIGQLGKLYEKAMQEVGEVNAAIFEVHQMSFEVMIIRMPYTI